MLLEAGAQWEILISWNFVLNQEVTVSWEREREEEKHKRGKWMQKGSREGEIKKTKQYYHTMHICTHTSVVVSPNLSSGSVGALIGQLIVVHKLVEDLIESDLLLVHVFVHLPHWDSGTCIVSGSDIKFGNKL